MSIIVFVPLTFRIEKKMKLLLRYFMGVESSCLVFVLTESFVILKFIFVKFTTVTAGLGRLSKLFLLIVVKEFLCLSPSSPILFYLHCLNVSLRFRTLFASLLIFILLTGR